MLVLAEALLGPAEDVISCSLVVALRKEAEGFCMVGYDLVLGAVGDVLEAGVISSGRLLNRLRASADDLVAAS